MKCDSGGISWGGTRSPDFSVLTEVSRIYALTRAAFSERNGENSSRNFSIMAKKREGEKNRSDDQGSNEKGDDDGNFSDPDDYVDNISDEGKVSKKFQRPRKRRVSELLGDLLRKRPSETSGVETLVAVDGIPVVDATRLPKLQGVINNYFSSCGPVANLHFPKDEAGKTKGYAFIEFKDPASAAEAVKKFDGHKLDKQHTFLVNHLVDFEKYEKVPEKWDPPAPRPYEDHGNLRYWLEDPDCYDQYSVIYEGGERTGVFWNSVPESTLIQERSRWTETYVEWSPMGTYLATFHRMGVALWGGVKFLQVVKFEHCNVQFIHFSPNENYVVTFAPHTRAHPTTGEEHPLIVWDVRTGLRKRGFQVEMQTPWPIFKWSHDDKYFARCTPEGLSVYETPSFGLLDKKSFKINGIRDFSWSPSANIIAYWVAEDREIPARVTLVSIPSRTEVRVKNLFSVADCKMHWQKSGDYLCVKVDRYAKAKKDNKDEMKYSGMFYNFEVFHMREKQIPVDNVEVKEPVLAFAWEPVGNKFAIIHGENPAINVSFYQVKPGQTTPVLLKKFERKTCNTISWSPQGQFCVVAGLKGMSGALDFIDTGSKEINIMASAEHFMVSDIEWDPTGRYVVTAVSFWFTKVDTGYWLWTFQGKLLQKHAKDKFCQLCWRPRPPCLLSAEQIKEIKKNLKKFSADFEVKDRMKQSKESKELLEKRSRLNRDFQEYRAKRQKDWQEQRKARLAMRDGVDTDTLDAGNAVMEEETIEYLVKEDIIVLEE
ncbi:unnamed protein product [Notodromas monacha]|uniref:Eukaryotic translation initiation factor 3 subunit B n=1 Tax=Notodromas monacha TaxID=399045 RepID=A0A7R9GAL9_9CRUS|nr:unnamed protein product [Notodromas monacha]CAG0914165.1 unnamed protein product [Notodromas monacha]